jgi:hypothetical protein
MNNNPGKQKKQGNGYGKGTFIDTSLFLSPAFISLGVKGTAPTVSTASPKMLIMFLGKRRFPKNKHKKISWKNARTDDNKFSLTYKELEARGIPQGMATRAFDELLAKGFIEIAHHGGAFDKDKTYYSLVDDFRRWRPGDPPIRTRPQDIKRGYQGRTKQKQRTSTGDTYTHVSGGHPGKGHARQQGTPLNDEKQGQPLNG